MKPHVQNIRSFYAKTIRNLDYDQLKTYHKTILRKYIYGTNAIEGSQLSEAEVEAVLTDEVVPKNRPNNDIWSVYNFTRLHEEDLSGPIDISMIKNIHQIFTSNIIDRDGKPSKSGEFRTAVVTISGSCHPVSRPDKIERDLAELIRWKENAKIDPIELAAIFHARFELIRPFLDFNGRVGRHILNLMLIREGLPAIYFLPNQRTAEFFNYRNIVEFVIKRMFISMLHLLSVSSILQILQIMEIVNKEIENLFQKAILEDSL
ncbi:MAG TPA: Fic family protein [Nitrososphaeraceae archaeon]|nr:Fic family protein [Nitrososphaeraceae archaeon]